MDDEFTDEQIEEVSDNPLWVGFGIAVDWIVRRGKDLSDEEYLKREDQAAVALIQALAGLDPATGDQMVEGIPSGFTKPDEDARAVPHGVWRETTFLECDTGTKKYHLQLVDSVSEFGGMLVSRDETYDQLRIRTFFVVRNWPKGSTNLDAVKQSMLNESGGDRRAYSGHALMLYLRGIMASVPEDLVPLTIDEFVVIAQARFPNASRDPIRLEFPKLAPPEWSSKRGPRGPRQPHRKIRVAQFSDELQSAELLK